eukprot:6185033-Pleurochrysis_carterae.AAC.1
MSHDCSLTAERAHHGGASAEQVKLQMLMLAEHSVFMCWNELAGSVVAHMEAKRTVMNFTQCALSNSIFHDTLLSLQQDRPLVASMRAAQDLKRNSAVDDLVGLLAFVLD